MTILHRLRLERGLSIRDLAKRAGVSHMTIRRFEQGLSTGQPGTRYRVARALEVPIDILLMPDTKNAPGREAEGAGGTAKYLEHATAATGGGRNA